MCGLLGVLKTTEIKKTVIISVFVLRELVRQNRCPINVNLYQVFGIRYLITKEFSFSGTLSNIPNY